MTGQAISEQKRNSREATASSARSHAAAVPWHRSTLVLGSASAVLLWLAHPPANLGFLGWIAPLFWLLLIRQPQLSGKRPYGLLYGVGVGYWAATTYWLTLPHWSTSLGWVAMSVYLACYVVLFIGLSRIAVHRLQIPLVIAAPVVWAGLELIRAHFATGFLMAALAHTQYRWIGLIQISDLAGAYGLSFLIMFVAACVAQMISIGEVSLRWRPAGLAVVAVAATLVYGHYRTANVESTTGPTVALIQGNVPTVFGPGAVPPQEIYREYITESRNALQENPDIQLFVWPESMFDAPFVEIEKDAWLPADVLSEFFGMPPEDAKGFETERRLPQWVYTYRDDTRAAFRRVMADLTAVSESATNSPVLLLGVQGVSYSGGDFDTYNTSVYVLPDGEIADHYHKMHLVMFGEYIPFGNLFPFLYGLTPLPGGLSAGDVPKAYQVDGVRFAPNICYETIMPHVIRSQIAQLRGSGNEPDVIVTQTNDGWFWGSAALDMHLICGVFRAVECRKPLLIAANTGISAHVDADGRIVQQAGRQRIESLIVRPQLDGRRSLYVDWGDWLGGVCAACCLLLIGVVLRDGFRRNRSQVPAPRNT